jgi:hypothetical protein
MRVPAIKLLCAALAGAGIGMILSQPAAAAKVVIEDSRCKQLDAANLMALEKQLKDSKAIAPGDTIECQTPASTSASQRNFPLTMLLPAFKTLFCRQKNSDVMEDCAKVADKAGRVSCESNEKVRFREARKAC